MQVPVKQKESTAIEHGLSFYRWLKNRIEQGLAPNRSESGFYITDEGLFIERNKLFKDFLERIKTSLSFEEISLSILLK